MGLATNQCLLARVGAVAVHALLLPMQQLRQRMLVVNVGRRHHRAVSQPAQAVDPNVELHAEMPVPAFAGLMHFGVARLLLVLGRTGRSEQGRIHNRAAIELHPAGLQNPAHLREELLAELVFIEQLPEFEHRRRIGHGEHPFIHAKLARWEQRMEAEPSGRKFTGPASSRPGFALPR